ncbi:MAG: 16S rRNA (cytosine(1402)-N(4))-methyltransferase [Ectothiorhodospiraceae bacterium]|nr:16S rRNA (cytosine(1402)-N(4))-methyltransferase [Ectothiorhodospiraceae bacterium]
MKKSLPELWAVSNKSHRITMYHVPVLAELAVQYLVTNSDGVYIDGTLGGGGHSALILDKLSRNGLVIGIDQDEDAVRFCKSRFADETRIKIVHENTEHMSRILQEINIDAVDGVLLDLGISSHQIDEGARGFSFREDGPLDMRMDLRTVASALDIVSTATAEELTSIIKRYGEERFAYQISKRIVQRRTERAIDTTDALKHVVLEVVKGPNAMKSVARVFQALRIAVNRELDVLDEILEATYASLKVGGRCVVISYHSLEDRKVKQFLKQEAPVQNEIDRLYNATAPGLFNLITRSAIQPDEDEVQRNNRARSARLRAAEKAV